MQYLTTPEFLHKGISNTSSARVISESGSTISAGEELGVSVIIPTHSDENYAYAIGVTSHVPTEALKLFSRSPDHLFHYAVNKRKKRSIVVLLDEENGLAMVKTANINRGVMVSAMLHFDLPKFQNVVRGRIDHDGLLDALRVTHVSELDKSVSFEKMLPDDTGSVLTGKMTQEIYRECVPMDDAFVRCTRTCYVSGIPTSRVSLYMLTSQNLGTHPGTVESLTSWATTCTLSRLPISPIPYAVSSKPPEGTSAERIAPATNPKSTTVSYAEEIDAIRAEKKEKRKIKNRIAAARSNAKRRFDHFSVNDKDITYC